MDRTVPPENPEGEAADGVVDAADRASRAPIRIKVKGSRASRTSRAPRPIPARRSVGDPLKGTRARAAAIADLPDPIAKSSADRAPGR